MKTLEKIKEEIRLQKELDEIERFKAGIINGTIKTISINKKYRELEASLATLSE